MDPIRSNQRATTTFRDVGKKGKKNCVNDCRNEKRKKRATESNNLCARCYRLMMIRESRGTLLASWIPLTQIWNVDGAPFIIIRCAIQRSAKTTHQNYIIRYAHYCEFFCFFFCCCSLSFTVIFLVFFLLSCIVLNVKIGTCKHGREHHAVNVRECACAWMNYLIYVSLRFMRHSVMTGRLHTIHITYDVNIHDARQHTHTLNERWRLRKLMSYLREAIFLFGQRVSITFRVVDNNQIIASLTTRCLLSVEQKSTEAHPSLWKKTRFYLIRGLIAVAPANTLPSSLIYSQISFLFSFRARTQSANRLIQ